MSRCFYGTEAGSLRRSAPVPEATDRIAAARFKPQSPRPNEGGCSEIGGTAPRGLTSLWEAHPRLLPGSRSQGELFGAFPVQEMTPQPNGFTGTGDGRVVRPDGTGRRRRRQSVYRCRKESSGVTDGPIDELPTGYSILEAGSLAAATEIAKTSPLLKSGRQIRVLEVFKAT